MLHLDCLRLIAAAGIVCAHTLPIIDKRLLQYSAGLPYFVDLFFVISGYVIARIYFDRVGTMADYGAFMRHRIARLGPLNWATLFIYAAIGTAIAMGYLSANDATRYDFRCFVPSFLMIQASGICATQDTFNGASWSISAEMFMYASAPAIFYLLRRHAGYVAAIVAFAYIALSLASRNWPDLPGHGGVVRAVPSFLFGALVFQFRETVQRVAVPRLGVWMLLMLFVASAVCGAPALVLIPLLYATAVGAVCADGSGKCGRLTWLCASGGQLTYSSYMLQDLVFMLIVSFGAERLLHLQRDARVFAAILAALAVWPISWCSLILFERPLRRWIAGVRRRPAITVVQH